MVSILDLQGKAEEPVSSPRVEEPVAEPQEFEFVLGRRQIASLLFVSIVILMICVAVSYLVGKSMSPKTSAVPAAVAAREPEPPPIVMYQEPVPVKEPPLFAEPKAGS